MTVLAAHQPNFCPYMGFFQKMKEVDLFVLLTEVQFEKGGYQNRFFYNNEWATMSVNRGLEPIKNKKYVTPHEDWHRIVTKYPKLEVFNGGVRNSLWWTNYLIIIMASDLLKIETPVGFDFPTDKTGSERLLEICQKHGATEYLSGIGGKKYLDVELFEKNGIKVIFQEESTLDKRSLVEII